jgi:FkbM family methyltransferase
VIIKNYIYIILAVLSKTVGRGKYYRKKLFSTSRLLNENFPENKEFSFLQVGANDGISFDFLYHFVTKREITGIVIEPIKEYYKELCENYKIYDSVLKVNKAVHEKLNKVIIYKIDSSKVNLYPDWVKGIASFDITNLTKFDFINKDYIISEEVAAEHLMDIISDSKMKHFDYFQVDTEGYDYQVVKMFNFDKYKPKLIKAEFVNLTIQEKNKMKIKLVNNGYYVFYEGLDIVGVNLNKISL